MLNSLFQKLTDKKPCSLLYIRCLTISYTPWKSLSEGGKMLIILLKEPVCVNKYIHCDCCHLDFLSVITNSGVWLCHLLQGHPDHLRS